MVKQLRSKLIIAVEQYDANDNLIGEYEMDLNNPQECQTLAIRSRLALEEGGGIFTYFVERT